MHTLAFSRCACSLFAICVLISGSLSPEVLAEDFELEERLVITNSTSTFIETLLGKIEPSFTETGNGYYSFKMRGHKVELFNQGKDIQLFFNSTGKNITLNRVNLWNRTHRFTRAYLNKEGAACLEADLDFEGGVTAEAIKSFIDIFAESVEAYAEYME